MKKMNWFFKFVVVSFLLILVIGCIPLGEIKQLSSEEIIFTPMTGFEMDILSRTKSELEGIINDIQMGGDLPNVNFAKEGALICKDVNNNIICFCFILNHQVVYNTSQTTYIKRASTTYVKNLFAFSKIIASYPKLFEEDKISGISIDFRWMAKDFLKDQYQSGVVEDMSAYIPKEVLRDFANNKISIQELSRQTTFTSSMGKVEMNFSDTL